MISLVNQNCVLEYENYLRKVAGDLCRALGKFENPALTHTRGQIFRCC